MKPSYGVCVLLCMLTIGLASSENDQSAILNQQTKAGNQATETTTAVPSTIDKSVNSEKASTTSASVPVAPKAATDSHTSTVIPETSTVPPSKPTVPPTKAPNSTTQAPTTLKPNNTTPVPTTTLKPSSTTPVPTTTLKPSSTTTFHPNVTTINPNVTTINPNVTTTAVPPVPHPPGRRFDGLSFLGGIILAVCLMAVGGFLWKFARTCNDRNYRTL